MIFLALLLSASPKCIPFHNVFRTGPFGGSGTLVLHSAGQLGGARRTSKRLATMFPNKDKLEMIRWRPHVVPGAAAVRGDKVVLVEQKGGERGSSVCATGMGSLCAHTTA